MLKTFLLLSAAVFVATAHAGPPFSPMRIEGVVVDIQVASPQPAKGGTFDMQFQLKGSTRTFRTEGKSEFLAVLLQPGERVTFHLDEQGSARDIARAD